MFCVCVCVCLFFYCVLSAWQAESVTVRCSAPYPSYGGIDNYPFRDTDKKKWLGRDERDDKARRDFTTAGRRVVPLSLLYD